MRARPRVAPRAILRRALLAAALCLPSGAPDAQPARPPGAIGSTPRAVAEDALALLAYSVVPDGTVSTLEIQRGGEDRDVGVWLTQFGAGFTVSPSLPLFLEGYLGIARYDPRFVFSEGAQARVLPTRWNQIGATVGVGWDIRLADKLYLRPIVNGALAHVTTDAALVGGIIGRESDTDLAFLERGRMNAWGAGGALVLAWYDHTPTREIDIELRGTWLRLETFAGTSDGLTGTSEALTVNLWSRLRWPTGQEAFGRPVRWVLEGQHSQFFGSQRSALGFEYLSKLGGGLEVDLGRLEVGAFGLTAQRLRLVGRYLFGEHASGFSLGLGLSF